MRINRPWRVAVAGAGAAALIAGLGGAAVASDGIDLHDKVHPIHVDTGHDDTAMDDSAESADSPHASPFDSANSPADAPAGSKVGGTAVDGSPESADSPNASAVDSPNPPKKPTQAKPKPAGDDSADSPAPRHRGGADSGSSAGSADSGASADSAD
ncbi:hypothetical protein [Micromonospora sp. CPCC 206061]|uniref:hypothetical protein n=1 Tax=Micromonospora sp. CPCC 206061 TaxID=3122410 RepID=UPI002FEE7206